MNRHGPKGRSPLNRGVVLEMISTIRQGIAGLKKDGHPSVKRWEYEFGEVDHDPGPGATPDTIRPQYTKLVALATEIADAFDARR